MADHDAPAPRTQRDVDARRALVLIVESDPFDVELLERLCQDAGHLAFCAASGEEALEFVARETPDWVFLGQLSGQVTTEDVLATLKEDRVLKRIPVTAISAEEGAESVLMQQGADAVLCKPLAPLRVRRHLAEMPQPGVRAYALGRRESRFPELPLQQAGTPEQLHIALEYELTRAARYHRALGFVLVAHAADASPEIVANAVRNSVRTLDHVFRAGAFEVAILLPETDAEGIAAVIARLESRLKPAEDAGAMGARDALKIAGVTFPSCGIQEGQALLSHARGLLSPEVRKAPKS